MTDYLDERAQLIASIQKYSSEGQWKHFISTLAEGLQKQMAEYCKYWQGELVIALEKNLMAKEKGAKFNFLNFPVVLYENSAEQKVDLVITGKFIGFMDQLEGNEAYWRKLLDAGKTDKSPDIGINHLLSEVYSELQNTLVEIIEDLARRNPLLYAPICMTTLQLADSYKQGFVSTKLLGNIAGEVPEFSVRHEFLSEALRQVAYNLEDNCDELFGDFLVFPVLNIEQRVAEA